MKGQLLRDALISAANNIANQRQNVDALNVFPVPDGDTGTNMSMTMNAAKRELERASDDKTIGEVANIAASALLRGARGNSGVILSLLFRGMAKSLTGKKTANSHDIAAALLGGVSAAYKAVMKPTEGTILTVARMAAQKAEEQTREDNISLAQVWKVIVNEAAAALEHTPEQLPVLKKAGVVDAGGKGLLVIFEGMLSVIESGVMLRLDEQQVSPNIQTIEINAVAEYDGEEITFTYCTEFIVLKSEKTQDTLSLRAYLESIGDSVVVVDDDEIIKCHVHTENPGDALQRALKFGQLSNMKIENMREQFAAKKSAAMQNKKHSDTFTYVPPDLDNEYGFVAIAAGEGVKQIFIDLGVDNVVSGGQTMNPSTDDILSAIEATAAKTVFVLPNNKNIIMAAEQTISLADRTVCVLPTRSIPQGLSAMLSFNPDSSVEANLIDMAKAFERVGTGQITYAARDSEFDGHKIYEGEILALENGKLTFVERDLNKALSKLLKSLVKRDSSFITMIYGEDVSTEQASQVEKSIRSKLTDDIELAMISGGQPVYYYLISVE